MAQHNPSALEGRFSVGQARDLLNSTDPALSRDEVQGVGVGLRDGRQAFVLTVADAKAKAELSGRFEHERIAGLPVHVDVSSFQEAATPGVQVDPDTLIARPSLWSRVIRAVLGLRLVLCR